MLVPYYILPHPSNPNPNPKMTPQMIQELKHTPGQVALRRAGIEASGELVVPGDYYDPPCLVDVLKHGATGAGKGAGVSWCY
jgi:hypothetical protein